MDSITTNGLTFRWSDDELVVTTPKGQYRLNASETAHLLDFLYAQKDEICDADAHTDEVAAWARQHPGQQFVIGSLNPQREPAAPLSLDEGRARRRQNENAESYISRTAMTRITYPLTFAIALSPSACCLT